MPVTKSEMMFFAAGAAVGAAAGANFPLLKEKFGPILAAALAGASSAVGDSYADLAKTVAEKVEAVQDAMAEMKESAASQRDDRSSIGLTCVVDWPESESAARYGECIADLITRPGFCDPISISQRKAPMDLAIRFPAQGRIHLESRFLFAEPDERNCRQFVERVFQAPEITQVTIRSQAGSSEVPRAELGFVRELTRSSRSSIASKTR